MPSRDLIWVTCAAVFVWLCVPETKGKSLNDIQRELVRHRARAHTHTHTRRLHSCASRICTLCVCGDLLLLLGCSVLVGDSACLRVLRGAGERKNARAGGGGG
jgi:hypothetical protein